MCLSQPWWCLLNLEASLNKNISPVRILAEFMLQPETKGKQAHCCNFSHSIRADWIFNESHAPTHCCLFTSVCLSFMPLIVHKCKPTIYFNSNLSEKDALICLRAVSDESANHIRTVHSLCLPLWKTSPPRNAGSGRALMTTVGQTSVALT